MKNVKLPIFMGLLLLFLTFSGCSSPEFSQEAKALQGNGFETQYHENMWTRLSSEETGETVQVMYNHKDEDAFFAVIRIPANTAKVQGLTTPEKLEELLNGYVTNYDGTKEKIEPYDTETDYVRRLSFIYADKDTKGKYTYLAKLVLNKTNGEMLAVLSAYPNKADKLIKEEINIILDNATIKEITESEEN